MAKFGVRSVNVPKSFRTVKGKRVSVKAHSRKKPKRKNGRRKRRR